jgi:integrase
VRRAPQLAPFFLPDFVPRLVGKLAEQPLLRALGGAGELDEQFRASLYRSADSLVFCHPQLGTPLDPSKVGGYMRKAIKAAGIERPLRPWHDLRHTALTHDAAAGNPAVYVQARAGHAQATMTERYVHAAQVSAVRLYSSARPSVRRSFVRGENHLRAEDR